MDDEADEEVTPEDLLRVARARRNEHNWEILVEWVDDLSDRDADAYQQVEPELLKALTEWPDELRAVPEHWWDVVEEGNLPWGWELCRSLVPPRGAGLDPGDIYKHVTRLDISQMFELSSGGLRSDEFELFTSLTHLDVSRTSVIALEELAPPPSLRVLVMVGCRDLESLDGLDGTNVTDLTLSPCAPDFARAIGRATQLERLSLGLGSWEDSLESLSGLEVLTRLHLDRVRDLRTLDGLQSLRRLESLTLFGSRDLSDTDALRDHPSLRRVSIARCPLVSTTDASGTP